MNEIELEGYIRDALRYRELRRHRNRGYPEPGIPYVNGWETDEAGKVSELGYIRERELDDAMDDVLNRFGFDVDVIYDKFVAAGVINEQ